MTKFLFVLPLLGLFAFAAPSAQADVVVVHHHHHHRHHHHHHYNS